MLELAAAVELELAPASPQGSSPWLCHHCHLGCHCHHWMGHGLCELDAEIEIAAVPVHAETDEKISCFPHFLQASKEFWASLSLAPLAVFSASRALHSIGFGLWRLVFCFCCAFRSSRPDRSRRSRRRPRSSLAMIMICLLAALILILHTRTVP